MPFAFQYTDPTKLVTFPVILAVLCPAMAQLMLHAAAMSEYRTTMTVMVLS